MVIGGWQKFSLLDYPGHIAAIVFTQGCNFRCQFCYNPMLVEAHEAFGKTADKKQEGRPKIEMGDLFAFLQKRQEKLSAIVISGGEPTLHPDLPDFIKKIKGLGYMVKLDTNGTNAKMLAGLAKAGLIDYIAMDIKNSPAKYSETVGVKADLPNIRKSIKITMKSGLPYEFRTTVVPGLIEPADINGMGEMIKGANKWFLQKFQSDKDLVNADYEGAPPYTSEQMEELRRLAGKYVKQAYCR